MVMLGAEPIAGALKVQSEMSINEVTKASGYSGKNKGSVLKPNELTM